MKIELLAILKRDALDEGLTSRKLKAYLLLSLTGHDWTVTDNEFWTLSHDDAYGFGNRMVCSEKFADKVIEQLKTNHKERGRGI
jgi:hypothetical protein